MSRPPSRKCLLFLGLLFVATTVWTWAGWGHVRVDVGGALHRAEKIADGALLYRDVQVHYPPLAPYSMGAIIALFGKHLNVIYLTGLLLLLIESALLWQIARRFLNELEAMIGLAAFWVLLAFQPGLFNWILPNVFAGTFASLLATAVVAVIISDIELPQTRKLTWASILVGATGLAKLEYGGAAYATLAIYVLFLRPLSGRGGEKLLRRRLTDLVRASAPGGLLTVAVISLIFSLVPWETVVYDNIYRVRSFSEVLDNYTESLFPPLLPEFAKAAASYVLLFPILGALATIGIRWLRRGSIDTIGGLFVLAVVAGGTYLTSRLLSPDEARNLYIQFQFTWTPLAWLALGCVACALREKIGGDIVWRTFAVVGFFSFLVTLRWTFRVAWPAYYAVFAPFLVVWLVRMVLARLAPNALERPAALAFVFSIWIATGAAVHADDYRKKTFALTFPRGTIYTTPKDGLPMKRVIDYLRNQVRPGEYVAVVPEEQFINFFSEAPHPTRDTGVGPGWLATRDDETRFLRELREKKTPFVIISNRRYVEFKVGGLDGYQPWLVQEIYRRYVPVAKTRFYRIMERKDRVDRRTNATKAMGGT